MTVVIVTVVTVVIVLVIVIYFSKKKLNTSTTNEMFSGQLFVILAMFSPGTANIAKCFGYVGTFQITA